MDKCIKWDTAELSFGPTSLPTLWLECPLFCALHPSVPIALCAQSAAFHAESAENVICLRHAPIDMYSKNVGTRHSVRNMALGKFCILFTYSDTLRCCI